MRDEGGRNTVRILGRMFSSLTYLKKALWLGRNIVSIMPSLGCIVLYAEKPAEASSAG